MNETNDASSNPYREEHLPAVGESDSRDEGMPLDTAYEETGTDEASSTYQDDLDYKDTDTDPVANEGTYSPSEELGVPEGELKDELDKYAPDDLERGDEDTRETIEDLDEDDDNAASAPQ